MTNTNSSLWPACANCGHSGPHTPDSGCSLCDCSGRALPSELARILGKGRPPYATTLAEHTICGALHPRSARKVCGAPGLHAGDHSWVIKTERED